MLVQTRHELGITLGDGEDRETRHATTVPRGHEES